MPGEAVSAARAGRGVRRSMTRSKAGHNAVITACYLNPNRQCRLAIEFSHALRGRNDVSQSNTKFVIDHDYLALGDERTVYHDIHRLACHRIEFDHRAMGQLAQIFGLDSGGPDVHS